MTESPSVEHFRNILAVTTSSLNELCEKWSSKLEEEGGKTGTNNNDADQHKDDENECQQQQEEYLGAIRSTIGQAKLLMSQRFKQFADLIDHCEFQTGQMPTRLNDLSGFWEMISFQVEDVLHKFNKLQSATEK